ncbi:MAG: DUF5011 domain-containing protein [Bacilli bacterium]|nr:DUF5011 domain-containing protein [Bacilli bacterium]
MKNNSNKFLYIIIAILVISIFVVGYLIIRNNNSNNNDDTKQSSIERLVLFGDEKITLSYNEKYQEPGYYALTSDGIVDTSNITITGNDFDTTVPGNYTITYRYKKLTKTRTITVKEKLDKESTGVLNLSLLKESVITLDLNEQYVEPGFVATYNDIDLTNSVTINSNLDTTKAGNYTITYTLNYNNQKKEVVRNIIVVDNSLDIKVTTNNTSYTNSAVEVTISITGNSFDYLLLPNNTIEKNKKVTYKVIENGEYTFKTYNNKNQEFTKSITISNIDKSSPTGTCNATLTTKSTEFKVLATDDISGIKNYIYKDNNKEITTTNSNSYTYNKKSKNVSVTLVDNAGNTSNISCSITDNSYLPVIKPSDSENVVGKTETDTLKAYISKFGNYYLTRIWVYDAYTQLNKYDSPEYGKNLYKPSVLLQKATTEYNLKDKFLIGFNASGFYLKDTYDASSVKKYPAYNKTSVGTLVITNGKVIRNVYDKGDLLTWFITGITPDNKMVVYEDKKMKETSVNEKKAWSTQVINSGIRNTYTFAAPVILDGKKTNYTNKNSRMPGSNSDKKGLQMICQINENNFVLFTTKNETRNTAINKFLELGCKTAVNLDGGGSVALVYKTKGSTEIKTVIGNGRALPEVGYFSE